MTRWQLVRHMAWPGVASTDGLTDDREALEAAADWEAMFNQFDALYLVAVDDAGPLSAAVAETCGGGWDLIDLDRVPPEVLQLLGAEGYQVLCRQPKWEADPEALEAELRELVGTWERKRGRGKPAVAASDQPEHGAPTLGTHAHGSG
jgi:hypothetical protein